MKLRRFLSSPSSAQTPILAARVRAPLELPTLNQNIDLLINQVIRLPEKGIASKLAQLVGGAPKGFFDPKALVPTGILIRNEYLNYWNKVWKQEKDVLVDGPEGCGKSTLLMVLASAWRDLLNRPLVLFTNMTRWVNGYYPYLPIENGTLYEQKELLLELVNDICVINPELKFQERILGEWHQEWKLGHAVLDTLTFRKVLESMPDETMFALDGFNALYTPATQYHDPEGKAVPGQNFALLRTLHETLHLERPKQRNRWRVLGVTSRTDPLNKCGLPEFCKRHQLSEYSVSETGILLEHYVKSGMIPEKGNVQMQRFISGGNAVQLVKTCSYQNLLY